MIISKGLLPCLLLIAMLPRDVRDLRTGSKVSKASDSKFPQYVRRLLDFRQMDFEATFDQMLNLLSIDPQRA